MLKVSEKSLDQMEAQYPGIKKQILRFENTELPPCSHCGSDDTANVQVGIIGRTINIAGATSKFTLIPNGPKPGKYYCNSCKKYFGEVKESDGEISGFTLRPKDSSLQAYKDFINQIMTHMGKKDADLKSEEEWEKEWHAFWDETANK